VTADNLAKHIFSANNADSFADIALEVFRYQAQNNLLYKEYLQRLNIDTGAVTSVAKIPFLPIEFFKSHSVISGNKPAEELFLSSGTTGDVQSKHHVSNLALYEQSFTKTFELFYGKPQQYVFLALLPSYLERTGSSLVYMVNKLIALSGQAESGFYLNNTAELLNKIDKLEQTGQKYILLGVTYALLDLAEQADQKELLALKHGIILETGGMKGMRKELVKSEVHELLKKAFGVNSIHSEYGMTELLSQAYSQKDGIFSCPPWMRVLIRDINDPFKLLEQNKTGGINIIDLANINSCSFIATQDLGKIYEGNTFEVLGRFDNSDIRGCNLLIN
jgi:phenylacetate-coenzyme A ligase PaaK-like adenylate-forming protein